MVIMVDIPDEREYRPYSTTGPQKRQEPNGFRKICFMEKTDPVFKMPGWPQRSGFRRRRTSGMDLFRSSLRGKIHPVPNSLSVRERLVEQFLYGFLRNSIKDIKANTAQTGRFWGEPPQAEVVASFVALLLDEVSIALTGIFCKTF